ncbi:hypothetical protein, partial [Polymorphobacter multimanifer]|uniref:hypothetical protein n=1 Tax=Polymorphobacter multimanifer TaxID=1070431 RepID=UPI00188B5A98
MMLPAPTVKAPLIVTTPKVAVSDAVTVNDPESATLAMATLPSEAEAVMLSAASAPVVTEETPASAIEPAVMDCVVIVSASTITASVTLTIPIVAASDAMTVRLPE